MEYIPPAGRRLQCTQVTTCESSEMWLQIHMVMGRSGSVRSAKRSQFGDFLWKEAAMKMWPDCQAVVCCPGGQEVVWSGEGAAGPGGCVPHAGLCPRPQQGSAWRILWSCLNRCPWNDPRSYNYTQ